MPTRWSLLQTLHQLALVHRRCLSKRPQSIVAADMLGNFEVQSQSKIHAQLRRFVPEHSLPELHPPHVYGGEHLANALLAAARVVTASKHQQPSSLSIEFLRPGAYSSPIEFSVTKMHESHRFTQTSVFLKQHERCLALANVAFHFEEHGPDTLRYDPPFPEEVPQPEDVPFTETWLEEQGKGESHTLSPSSQVRLFLGKILGVQIKALDPMAYLLLNKSPTIRNRFWVRMDPAAVDAVMPSLGEYWSAAVLAYISDFCLLAPALTQRPGFRISRILSLNHAMWFFANRTMLSPTEWILCELKLLHSGNNLCLCESSMWSQDRKRLLCVNKQQGLIRPHKKAPKPDVSSLLL